MHVPKARSQGPGLVGDGLSFPGQRGQNPNNVLMTGVSGFNKTCVLKQGAVAYFDGVINHRGRHSTGRLVSCCSGRCPACGGRWATTSN